MVEKLVPVRTPLDDSLLQQPDTPPCMFPATAELYIFDLDQWSLCLEQENIFFKRQLGRIIEANKKAPNEGG